MAYLDHCATTPIDDRVLAAMLPWFGARAANASGADHLRSIHAADAVHEARERVAASIGAAATGIVFTGGATEAVCTAIRSALRDAPGRSVVATAIEHRVVADAVAAYGGRLVTVPVDRDGRPDLEALAAALRSHDAALVAAMAVNNELGTVLPVPAIGRLARDAGVPLLSDLTQAVGRVAVDVRAMGVDYAAFAAHKLHGPPGVGALFVAAGRTLEPLLPGTQEDGRRGGTINLPGVVGFGVACDLAVAAVEFEAARCAALRDRLERSLLAELDECWVNAADAARVAQVSSVGFRGVDARTLVRDMADVAVSTRSACSARSAEPSHVLRAIGLSDDDAFSCVRFCLGRDTTEADVDLAIERTLASVRKLRRVLGRGA